MEPTDSRNLQKYLEEEELRFSALTRDPKAGDKGYLTSSKHEAAPRRRARVYGLVFHDSTDIPAPSGGQYWPDRAHGAVCVPECKVRHARAVNLTALRSEVNLVDGHAAGFWVGVGRIHLLR